MWVRNHTIYKTLSSSWLQLKPRMPKHTGYSASCGLTTFFNTQPNSLLVFKRLGLIWSPCCPYFLLVSTVEFWLIFAGGEIYVKRIMEHLTDIRCLSFFIRCPWVTFWKPCKHNKTGYTGSLCSILIRRNVNGKRLSFCQNKQSNMHLSIAQLSARSPGIQSN